MLNPYSIIGAILVAILLVGGGYAWGDRAADNACKAAAGVAAAKIEAAEDARDAAIDAIGASVATLTAAAAADTQGSTYESAERIRTITVSEPCRAVPVVVVRETDAAVDRINTKVRGGVRPGAADAGPARPKN